MFGYFRVELDLMLRATHRKAVSTNAYITMGWGGVGSAVRGGEGQAR